MWMDVLRARVSDAENQVRGGGSETEVGRQELPRRTFCNGYLVCG